MPTPRQLAIFAATEHVVRAWPLAARIAFRDAVLAHPTTFCGETWDLGEVLIALHHFADQWANGRSWPPAGPPGVEIDRAAVTTLANAIAMLGIELAETVISDEASRMP